jgi:glutathione S-transferase
MLEELNQAYSFKKIDFTQGDHHSPEYLAINPGGKIPAISIDDYVMTESAAIVTHLADSYSNNTLIPAIASKQRARYEQWAFFALCELEQPLWTMGKHKFSLPEELRVPEILPTAIWEFQKALALLSEGLGENNYMLGEAFSAVDILLSHTLLWAVAFNQPVEQQNLQAYLQRCQQRPALQRAKEKESA